MGLCLLFGIKGPVASFFLRFGLRILLTVVSGDDKSSIGMPSRDEIASFQEPIGARYSMLKDVFCLSNGLKLTLEQTGDFIIQNMFYIGWTHDHYFGNVFVFTPSVVIISCALNAKK